MIPIARPMLGEEEARAAREAILSGWVTQGPKVAAFEAQFASFVGSPYACAVANCTAALHLALLVVGVEPGDVVISVSHSFIATANAVRHCGAEPVFVDVSPDDYNLSPAALEAFVRDQCERRDGALYYRDVERLVRGESPLTALVGRQHAIGRVAAIVPVHQIGMPCEIEAIANVARRFGLPLVEDAACAIGSEVDVGGKSQRIGRPHGDIACFSLHPRKLITTGEGGLITTQNAEYDARFRLLRHHGMGVSDLLRHESPEVIVGGYPTTGYNYRLSDIQAAVGIEQLKRLPAMLEERAAIDAAYRRRLADLDWLRLPTSRVGARSNWQSYAVRVLEGAPLGRDALMQHLCDHGVSSRPGIMNAHQERPYADAGWSLPESERARDEVLLLPFFNGMTDEELERVCAALHAAR
ncbi:MAG: DegT/DnrJ/EryC1/StrS family aminotransferase [Myxococcales bacterium]|nr:DegT/DnrJ/EryC1/StrS family aminotransferase [Myxococcales bacterium]